jgi:hypothetical protein
MPPARRRSPAEPGLSLGSARTGCSWACPRRPRVTRCSARYAPGWTGSEGELASQIALLHGQSRFNKEWKNLLAGAEEDAERRFGGVDEYGECCDDDLYGPDAAAFGREPAGRGRRGWAKRLTVPDYATPARSRIAIDRLIARREVHLREKTLWRMLYETAGRSDEILGVNIEELDFAGRRCQVKPKGARTKDRRRARRERTSCWRRSTGMPAPPGSCPACSRDARAGRCSSPTADPVRGRSSARAMCARTPASPGCRMGRHARCWTSTPP